MLTIYGSGQCSSRWADTMLGVRKYLLSGHTIADLEKDPGIESVVHPDVPLVI